MLAAVDQRGTRSADGNFALGGNHHWYSELGELIDRLGTGSFIERMQEALSVVAPHDHFLVVLYVRNSSAEVMAADFGGSRDTAVSRFARDTFVLDPIFRLQARGSAANGVFEMRQLAEEVATVDPVGPRWPSSVVADDHEPLGFRTVGWPQGQRETCVLVQLDRLRLLSISTFEQAGARHHSDAKHRLEMIFPALSSLIRQHYSSCFGARVVGAPRPDGQASRPSVSNIVQFFRGQHEVELRPSEARVLCELLQGRTASEAAGLLELSEHTVTTHRRNVLRRVGHLRLPQLMSQFHRFESELTGTAPS